MSVNKRTDHFLSSNEVSPIAYFVWEDDSSAPMAIVQIMHGMAEYVERYDDLARFLASNGAVVCGCDYLGHGKSISESSPQGYFSDEDLPDVIIEDQAQMISIMRKKYRHLPYIILGHSMGSFVARRFTSLHADMIDGAIYCGTVGSSLPVGAGKALASIVGFFRGKKHQSRLLQKISSSGYTKKCEKDEGPFAWLSRDRETVRRYEEDENCGFAFSAKAYRQMFSLISYISSPEWYDSVPQSLPIYIIAGEEDPVGSYGKGPTEVYDLLVDKEISDISIKLYPGMRHEIHNEIGREEVYSDILAFAAKVADGVADARSYANTIKQ